MGRVDGHGNELLEETWRIKVKVARTWLVFSKYGKKDKCFFECVLIDEQGNKIHATIRKYLIKKYENIVKEGVTYELFNFSVEKSEGSPLPTKHPYKLIFHHHTQMKRSTPLQIMKSEFQFISFDDINSQSEDDDKILRDIIAVVVDISDVEPVDVNGTPKNKLDIDIHDKSFTKIKCTLWEGHFEKLLNYNNNHPSDPIIITLDYAKIQKRFKGKIVSNSMYASRLTINADTPEVHDFRNCVTAILSEIPPPTVSPNAKRNRSTHHQFNEDMEVSAIADITEVFEECYYVVVATIDKIDNDYSWYYQACPKCVKKIVDDDGKFSCEKCDIILNVFDIRYKIVIRVVDESGSTSLTLFDKDVIPLIGKTPMELLTHLDKKGLNDTIPKEIDGLVGRKFIFRFHITELHLTNKWNRYAVVKLSEDKKLINAIEQKNRSKKDFAAEDSNIFVAQVNQTVPPTEEALHPSEETPYGNKRKITQDQLPEDENDDANPETSTTHLLHKVKIEKI